MEDLSTVEACIDELASLLDELESDLEKMSGKERIAKAFVKLKFSDFKTTTKECVARAVSREIIVPMIEEAFDRNPESVRLMGVGVRFEEPGKMDERQLELFV